MRKANQHTVLLDPHNTHFMLTGAKLSMAHSLALKMKIIVIKSVKSRSSVGL